MMSSPLRLLLAAALSHTPAPAPALRVPSAESVTAAVQAQADDVAARAQAAAEVAARSGVLSEVAGVAQDTLKQKIRAEEV